MTETAMDITGRPAGLGPLDVRFVAVDGSEAIYSFAHLPAPAFHADIASAFKDHCDSGAIRTVKTAGNLYSAARRFLSFLGQLEAAPSSVTELTPEHMRQYLDYRTATTTPKSRRNSWSSAARLLRHVSPVERLSHDLRIYLSYSRAAAAWEGVPDGVPAEQPPLEDDPGDSLRLVFTAPDGRRRLFDFTALPLPALHPALASAFRTVLYRDGQAVPFTTAENNWFAVRRFLIHLATTENPPASVSELAPGDFGPFRDHLAHTAALSSAAIMINQVRNVLGNVRPYELLGAELRHDLEHAVGAPAPALPKPRAAVPRPGKGRSSVMPEGAYEPETARAEAAASLKVHFTGEDGRHVEYDFTGLPFPAFHPEFASAWAVRTGPTGALRTRASADTAFGCLRRFLTFMGSLANPPKALGELTVRHLERFRMHRLEGNQERTALNDLMVVRATLRLVVPFDVFSEDLRDFLQQPGLGRGHSYMGAPGYSDREFRDLVAAARSDVVAIRDRIRKGERLLDTFRTDPDSLTQDERTMGAHLDRMDRTGFVPVARTHLRRPVLEGRAHLARQLFLGDTDLAPLIILAAGVTGRNAETLKDLPAEHRVLDDLAVAVNLTKRRRGKSQTRTTVHWETGGSDSRQLHTPGGYYLLLHQLTERSRRFSGTSRVWSIWAGTGGRQGADWEAKSVSAGHVDPFSARLGRVLYLSRFAERHGLMDDNGNRLEISLNRIKTTVEVRTTKAMGGHLPSASRTNTLDVSFAHYLQGDPVVREWADEILTTAIDEAENHARGLRPQVVPSAEARRLADAPHQSAAELGTTAETLHQALGGQLDTVATSCLDIDHSPFSAGRCDVSFLTCLRCPNALITHQHLPALLALVDELDRARQAMGIDAWVHEHGRTWLALTRLILPQFTDAERAETAMAKPASLGLDLLDGPKELG
ncbi:hypothetical protein ACFWIB_03410 [Streptomyces sp. NPDC127051]|uniref:hypothetical protein n=1 Tax=Streptomyces sp. NPDC127051 TaxID=3347119 RepID=UPI003655B7E3